MKGCSLLLHVAGSPTVKSFLIVHKPGIPHRSQRNIMTRGQQSENILNNIVWNQRAIYSVCINYRRISLGHNLSRKCCKIVHFVSITHSEDNVYVPPLPKTLPDLWESINTAIGNVTQDMFERVWRECAYRLDICRVTRGGAHRMHLTFWHRSFTCKF